MVTPAVRLPNGALGYVQRREDDCMRAAVATILGCAPDEVPDPMYDARVAAGETHDEVARSAGAELTGWLARRRLRMVVHRRLPIDRPRWLGVSRGEGHGDDHVVVMSGGRIVHDPAAGFAVPPGCKVEPIGRIDYGLTFEPLEPVDDALDDYPSRVRIVVDEDQGQNQLGLLWNVRSRHYATAATAAARFEAEALNPLDTATRAALTGASGGTVVTHSALAADWTPVLDMRGGGTAYPTHTGTNRLWVRYRTTSGTAVQLRVIYDVGDLVVPVENSAVRTNAGTQFFLADLGELRIDRAPVGVHRWQGMIQGRGDTGSENVSIDKVYVLNADEGYGALRAPSLTEPGLASYSAHDEFDHTAGALVGKVLPIGGTWSGAGDGDDFSTTGAFGVAQRVAMDDFAVTAYAGARFELAGATTPAAIGVQADHRVSASTWPSAPAPSTHVGVFARYSSVDNWIAAWDHPNGPAWFFAVMMRVGGVQIPLGATENLPPFVIGEWWTIRLVVLANGQYFAWRYRTGGAAGKPLIVGQDPALATGGALATGRIGLYDGNNGGGFVETRQHDRFFAWVPGTDAVVYASQSIELRTDGIAREDPTGVAYGPVGHVVGDLPRLPPTVEGRTTEVFLKTSRGDLDSVPDTGIDDVSARITYRPCWLTVPGT